MHDHLLRADGPAYSVGFLQPLCCHVAGSAVAVIYFRKRSMDQRHKGARLKHGDPC